MNLIDKIDENNTYSQIQELSSEQEKKDTQVISAEDNKIELSKYRFVIVICYFLLTFSNGMHWVTFSSCAVQFGKYYHLSTSQVNLLSMIFMIIYPFAYLPESYIIDKISMRLGLVIADISTVAGAIVKCFINKHIFFAYLAQILVASFQPAILNCSSKVASTWFDEKTRVLVTSICVTSDTIGILVGYIIHNFVYDENNIKSEEDFRNKFLKYIIIECIITCVFCAPLLFLFKEKPKYSPSKSQQQKEKMSLGESLKNLFKNKNFMFLFISSSFSMGYYNLYGTILSQLLYKYNVKESFSSTLSSVSNLCGIIFCFVVSVIIDKVKKYKIIFIILIICDLVFLVIITTVLETISSQSVINTMSFIFYTLIITALMPYYSIVMDFSCEISYPVGESISNGLIMSSAQIIGIITILLCGKLMNTFSTIKYLSNVVGIGMFLISLICLCFVKDDLIRNIKDVSE